MKHYLHHLFFDPLGFFDQVVRDGLIAIGLSLTIIVVSIIYVIIEHIIAKRRRLREDQAYFRLKFQSLSED